MQLTISAYTTALFATWYFIEELRLLFDAGDGVTAGLLQKARKIEHVLVSHADRDHLAGLLQFNQLNARANLPIIYYPKDCGSFPRLEEFLKKFDPHSTGAIWRGIGVGEKIILNEELYVQPLANNHVTVSTPQLVKSLSYLVVEQKQKLQPAYLSLTPQALKNLMAEKGKEALMTTQYRKIVGYSGDTPVDDTFEQWNHTDLLIHEATFLSKKDLQTNNHRGNRHSSLEEVLQRVAELAIKQLVLGHFSSRYTTEQIDEAIRRYCKEFGVKIPVYRVLPSQIHRNILAENPVNA